MAAVLTLHPVVELAFDPIVLVGDWHVRLQTLVLAGVLLLATLAAARIARLTPVDADLGVDEVLPPVDEGDEPEPNHLRRDDLLYVVVASLPGAVLGGRMGYALLHADYYAANPGALVDIGQGGLSLTLGIVGGVLSGAVVATLLGAPVGRWLHALILPLLFAVAGGKLSMLLGGEGQGLPWDGPWATAYAGPGPWLSLGPGIPSHPSPLYEAFLVALAAALLAGLLASGAFSRRDGSAFLAGLALYAGARFAAALSWRDPAVAGPLRADQVVSLFLAAGCGVLLAVLARRRALAARGSGDRGAGVAGGPRPGGVRRATTHAGDPRSDEPSWPDPSTRPNI